MEVRTDLPSLKIAMLPLYVFLLKFPEIVFPVADEKDEVIFDLRNDHVGALGMLCPSYVDLYLRLPS